VIIGNQSVPVKPNEWKNGSTPTMTSAGVSANASLTDAMFSRMLWCVSITPLGTPVLPLEKITVAISCGSAGGQKSRSRRLAGNRRTAASINAFCVADVDASMSSRKIMPAIVSMPAFARKVFDVTIVRMPQRSIAAAIASWPAVKFRLTGMQPAIDVPMLASAPPTEAGNSSPTYRDGSGSRRIARESSRLPTSARPKVSSRPVESAMQNEANCRFAVRMNRAPRVWEDMGRGDSTGPGRAARPASDLPYQWVVHPARWRSHSRAAASVSASWRVGHCCESTGSPS